MIGGSLCFMAYVCQFTCTCTSITYVYFCDREHFVGVDGELLKEGDMLYQNKLAHTLEMVANEGWQTFYTGSVAALIIEDIQQIGRVICASLYQYV